MIDQAPDTWHDPSPGRHYGDAYWHSNMIKEDADAKALRSFWRGVSIGLSVMPVIGALVVAIVWGLS